MKLGIHTNPVLDKKFEIASRFAVVAASHGFVCGGTFAAGGVQFFDTLQVMTQWADMIVVIGGDGTILSAAGFAAKKDLPIIAVHNGSLGFLTEIKIDEAEKALEALKRGDYKIESRQMIETVFEGETHIALNEILIARHNRSSVCKLKVFCNDEYLDTYVGDGLIISTATGSTGYSFSAGGPILSPELDGIVLTPLCTHGFNGRAVVLNADNVLRVEISGRDDFNCIHIDGRLIDNDVKVGTSFEIKMSKFKTKFVRFSETSFYTRLYSKLDRNQRDR